MRMQVSVYQDQALIGIATLEHLDPPMGVAFGPFTPTDRYERDKHTNTVEGNYVDDKGQSLSVRDEQHGFLKTASSNRGLGRSRDRKASDRVVSGWWRFRRDLLHACRFQDVLS